MLKHLTIISVIAGILCCCGTSKSKISDKQANEPESSQISDTMDVRPPPPLPGLPPGTARITGMIVSLSGSDDNAEIKVLSVDEYGSSTPVIASNTTMRVSVSKSLKEKLKVDKKIVCLLNYQQVLGSGKNQTNWTLKKISPLED
jgi:hypothetical protein